MAGPLEKVYRLKGKVVKGFGRGSKLLGCPTANLEPAAFKNVLTGAPRGVYYGWASINSGPVYKSVLSIGWNPQFTDQKEETVEVYLLHSFAEEFYGAQLKLLICGFIRSQEKFDSVEALMKAIQQDIEAGSKALESGPLVKLKDDPLFLPNQTPNSNNNSSSSSKAGIGVQRATGATGQPHTPHKLVQKTVATAQDSHSSEGLNHTKETESSSKSTL
eukprot:gb/GEZN01019284.1/.p1 GENE.gb/GEZN01019284.1/~~gb/GEZN01019284.1/.p1  ORF type:complete len:218 (-),score=26.67 gb/GEZN01019284.1/:50-703(-)